MKSIFYKLTALIILFAPQQVGAKSISNDPGQLANPFFWMLLAIIVLLLVIIVGLSNSISQVIQYKRKKKNFTGPAPKTILVLLAAGTTLGVSAQTNPSASAAITQVVSDAPEGMIYGMPGVMFYALIGLILFELIVIFSLTRVLRSLIEKEEKQPKVVTVTESKSSVFWQWFNRSVSVEKEKDIMMGHEYDGIRELDNNLPPWWIYGFYITIIWSVGYMVHYHISKSGPLQEEEYRLEMAAAQEEINAYLARAANNVDENSFKISSEPEILQSGQAIYKLNCVACHGVAGEGKVGPNLTDNYWLHGGSQKEVFSSVKYGWVEKGMKAWKDDLTPTDIGKLISYIFSLKGTNPQGGKGPEGEVFDELVKDSTVVIDTLNK